jgi:putative sigma-54 modulation protein
MPVDVLINVRNLELDEQLREYVEKRVSKLDRFLDVLEEAKVDLTYAKTARSANDRQVAQLTVRGKGVLLRAEERSDDIYASVDAVLDKISRQIERFKGRHWRTRGDGRPLSDAVQEPGASSESAEAAPEAQGVVRRKHFLLVPMTEVEAVEQMDLLGHPDFFVFFNAETSQVNVLYRRRDESLGLIETEVA